MTTILISSRTAALALPLAFLGGCTWAAQPRTPDGLDEANLRAHLYAFADDSMLGRRAGTEGGVKASRFLAARLARAGLQPAGENGSFYQQVPLVRVRPDVASTLFVGGEPLRPATDFVVAGARWRVLPVINARVVFLGTSASDTTGWPSRDNLRGRVILFDRTAQQSVNPGTAANRYLAAAAAVLVAADLESLPQVVGGPVTTLAPQAMPAAMPPDAPVIYVSRKAAELALGGPLAAASIGQQGALVSGDIRMTQEPLATYNVVALLRGADPLLRDEYVVIGAHPDHTGARETPLDHDSLRAVLLTAEAIGHQRGRRLTATERAQLTVRVDTLTRSQPVRRDSVFNGADDDGSGSVVVLGLAEFLARSARPPRRSILFVWHHAEELGLLGSRYFTDHPTVPRDRIIAAVNLDMVGRGRAEDIPGGGPRYVQIVGSRRLSTELGDIVEAVNRSLWEPMQLDYSMDAEGHPERIYCRSDHASYARYGIPVVFFTTGLHPDYHQLTDEPQYIDYAKLRRVGALAGNLVLHLANAEHRPRVDRPAGDPFAPCRQ